MAKLEELPSEFECCFCNTKVVPSTPLAYIEFDLYSDREDWFDEWIFQESNFLKKFTVVTFATQTYLGISINSILYCANKNYF